MRIRPLPFWKSLGLGLLSETPDLVASMRHEIGGREKSRALEASLGREQQLPPPPRSLPQGTEGLPGPGTCL